jgi:trimethylamine--corrinoid protein Co-methyltransferase
MSSTLKNEYRPSTAPDLYDAARLAHHLDNIHFFQRTMVCCEIGPRGDGPQHALRLPAGTTKHVGTSFSDPAAVDPAWS